MKKRFKKELVAVIIMALVVLTLGSVFAKVTDSTLLTDKPSEEGIPKMLSDGLSMFIAEPIIKAITILVKFFISIVASVLSLLFKASGIGLGTNLYFPLPQHMVFNLIPMLDPNFINPTTLGSDQFSLMEMFSSIISPIYFTLVSVAGSAFVIIALYIGLKLVLSISPQEKAQYKSAILAWVTGIALLGIGHIIMSGVFFVNEQIVSNLYKASEENFTVQIFVPSSLEMAQKIKVFLATAAAGTAATIMLGPLAGLGVGGALLAKFSQASIEFTKVEKKGFEGLISLYVQRMTYNDDPIATLIVAIMIGQIVALVILYLKRLIYTVVLGLLFPFVVLMDTYRKVSGQKGAGLFEKWVTQFALTVFMQSIHAVLMYLIIMLVNSIYTYAKTSLGVDMLTPYSSDGEISEADDKVVTILMFVQVGAIASLTRLDDLVKEYVGVPDAKAGSLHSSGMLGYSAVRLGTTAVKNVADNFTGVRSGRRDVLRLRNKINNLKDKERQKTDAEKDKLLANSEVKDKPVTPINASLKSTPAPAGPFENARLSMNDIGTVAEATGTDNPGLVRIQGTLDKLLQEMQKTRTATASAISSQDRLVRSSDGGSDASSLSSKGGKQDTIEDLSMELKEKEGTLAGKRIAQIASFGFVPGSLAMGVGMTSSLSDAATVSSAMITLGDKISESIGKNLPRQAQASVVNQSVKYEEYLQQKIINEYSNEKYTRPTTSNNSSNNNRHDRYDIGSLE